MKTRLLALTWAVATVSFSSQAEVKVVTEHKANADATAAFSFKNIPHPKAGLKAKVTIVDGDSDNNGGGIEKLTDGQLPTEEDQPTENFFFDANTPGGRIRFDFNEAKPIGQINTFSWHPGTRGPQVYKVYGASGTASDFNSSPKSGLDPLKCGWTFIAEVDTRKDGETGGQYGVSVRDTSGTLGTYRYLLFDVATTESDDGFGNTFYSEFNVLPPGDEAAAAMDGGGKGGISVLVDRTDSSDATGAFKFKRVPAPSKKAYPGKFVVVDGEVDANGGGVEKLSDADLPSEEDQPSESFFFEAGMQGGRVKMDLSEVKEIAQINTYSWHPNTRGPQVYKVYGATGSGNGFNSSPKNGTDPATCGWTFIAAVDTRPKDGESGGQYGVCIHNAGGTIGKYRYLLFDISTTETDDPFGNTFYSKINVLGPNEATPVSGPTTEADEGPKIYVAQTADGKYEIDFNYTAAPDLADWIKTTLSPALVEWYPKIVDYFPSDGYEAPKKFTVMFKNGKGVADTSGTRVNAYLGWIRSQLKGEAVGSLVHEAVHVVQQYDNARWHKQHAQRNPGFFVEGVADYYRFFKFEPQTKGAEIRRRSLDRANYDGSYRTTANFLNWVSDKYDKDLVPKLNAAMREGNYTDDFWAKNTGKTVEQLNTEWKENLKKQLAGTNTNKG